MQASLYIFKLSVNFTSSQATLQMKPTAAMDGVEAVFTALATGTPTTGPLPLTVQFDGSQSVPAQPGDTLSYSASGLPLGATFDAPDGYTARTRTLNEGFDPYGRLQQFVGTGTPGGAGGTVYGMNYEDALKDEERHAGDGFEVWDVYNTTGDTHPIHFHLVNMQIIARQPFKVTQFNGVPAVTGVARGPVQWTVNRIASRTTTRRLTCPKDSWGRSRRSTPVGRSRFPSISNPCPRTCGDGT